MKTSSSRSPLQRASGESRVVFERRDGQTRLADLYQRDPCRVLFPAPEPGEPPQAVMITTSGGVTDGDSLVMAVEIGPEAGAVATTQAAEKIYRAAKGGGHCGIDVRLAYRFREALGLTTPVAIVPAGSLPRFEMKARRFVVEG